MKQTFKRFLVTLTVAAFLAGCSPGHHQQLTGYQPAAGKSHPKS